LHLLRSRHEAAGRTLPNTDAVDATARRLAERGLLHGLFGPGPLEGHKRPLHPPPDEVAGPLVTAFDGKPDGPVWFKLSRLSQLFAFDESVMAAVRQAIQGVVPENAQAERDGFHMQVEHICLLAAAQRDVSLAREIGATLVRQAPTVSADQEVGAILMALLLAGAAFEDEQAWSIWLAGQLVEVAARLPPGEMIRQFALQLEELERVLPAHLPIHARAAALCAAAPQTLASASGHRAGDSLDCA
jgi:hypothetical protein